MRDLARGRLVAREWLRAAGAAVPELRPTEVPLIASLLPLARPCSQTQPNPSPTLHSPSSLVGQHVAFCCLATNPASVLSPAASTGGVRNTKNMRLLQVHARSGRCQTVEITRTLDSNVRLPLLHSFNDGHRTLTLTPNPISASNSTHCPSRCSSIQRLWRSCSPAWRSWTSRRWRARSRPPASPPSARSRGSATWSSASGGADHQIRCRLCLCAATLARFVGIRRGCHAISCGAMESTWWWDTLLLVVIAIHVLCGDPSMSFTAAGKALQAFYTCTWLPQSQRSGTT